MSVSIGTRLNAAKLPELQKSLGAPSRVVAYCRAAEDRAPYAVIGLATLDKSLRKSLIFSTGSVNFYRGATPNLHKQRCTKENKDVSEVPLEIPLEEVTTITHGSDTKFDEASLNASVLTELDGSSLSDSDSEMSYL